MFHHVVLMQLSGADTDFHRKTAELIDQLRAELPFVRSYAFVKNMARRSSGYEWAMISSFDNSQDHDRYQVSDIHRRLQEFMRPYIDQMVVCDADV